MFNRKLLLTCVYRSNFCEIFIKQKSICLIYYVFLIISLRTFHLPLFYQDYVTRLESFNIAKKTLDRKIHSFFREIFQLNFCISCIISYSTHVLHLCNSHVTIFTPIWSPPIFNNPVRRRVSDNQNCVVDNRAWTFWIVVNSWTVFMKQRKNNWIRYNIDWYWVKLFILRKWYITY